MAVVTLVFVAKTSWSLLMVMVMFMVMLVLLVTSSWLCSVLKIHCHFHVNIF
jgi:hypothetical protein